MNFGSIEKERKWGWKRKVYNSVKQNKSHRVKRKEGSNVDVVVDVDVFPATLNATNLRHDLGGLSLGKISRESKLS